MRTPRVFLTGLLAVAAVLGAAGAQGLLSPAAAGTLPAAETVPAINTSPGAETPVIPAGFSSSPDWAVDGTQNEALYGNWVSTAGDVNGDGYDEVLVSAPFMYNDLQLKEGHTFLYMGSASGLSTTPAWSWESNQAYAEQRVATAAGDINGDGYGDVLVGAPKYDDPEPEEGIIWLFYGSPSGLSATPGWTGQIDVAYSYLGVHLAGAGDVNNDGYDDIYAGAHGYTDGETNEGAAFVWYGGPSGPAASPDWSFQSDQENALMGAGGGVGDVNGDGIDDIVVGALWYDIGPRKKDADRGRAWVFRGSAVGLLSTPLVILESGVNTVLLGGNSVGGGDLNGDGYNEVVLNSDWNGDGYIHIYHGGPGGPGSQPTLTIKGPTKKPYSNGYGVVRSAGDVNDDGYGDLVVGSNTYGPTVDGRAYIYTGSADGIDEDRYELILGNDDEGLGISVSGAGDVNGDGFDDIILGAHAADPIYSNEGRAEAYYGNGGIVMLEAKKVLIARR